MQMSDKMHQWLQGLVFAIILAVAGYIRTGTVQTAVEGKVDAKATEVTAVVDAKATEVATEVKAKVEDSQHDVTKAVTKVVTATPVPIATEAQPAAPGAYPAPPDGELQTIVDKLDAVARAVADLASRLPPAPRFAPNLPEPIPSPDASP